MIVLFALYVLAVTQFDDSKLKERARSIRSGHPFSSRVNNLSV